MGRIPLQHRHLRQVDGRDVSRSLTLMGYCTRMQSFIGSLDFANTTTVDTEAVS